MTPDLQAAANRVRAFLDVRDAEIERQNRNPIGYRAISFVSGSSGAAQLHAADLRALLAALDPAEQPIGHITTSKGTQAVLDYRAIRRQQHPRGETP